VTYLSKGPGLHGAKTTKTRAKDTNADLRNYLDDSLHVLKTILVPRFLLIMVFLTSHTRIYRVGI
jgi:hypothetical protein